ncbi:hypothetical protein JYG23_14000 [Sedimentibacter sp. zth1]|uniref:hypothetical protein n=1 Tax=Sedimentibacter sp. zth1 TaxID=2816908 RepID=UPI001A930F87|nr:hypothetical protein [Sedimentibacter sp. zth1]QSX05757.1 hypothetical protein JYG23_14000 [Sedimentibacter sp. zth1]
MEINKKYSTILNNFKNKVIDSCCVKAIIVYGSYASSELWKKSNLNIWVITDMQNIKDKDQYSIEEDDVVLNIEVFAKDFLLYMLSSNQHKNFYNTVLHKCKLYYCVDNDIERLCVNRTSLAEEEKIKVLLREGCYAVSCLRKAEKILKHKQNLVLGYSIISRLVNHLAKIEVAMANQYNNEYVEDQAIKLNHDCFYSLYIDLINSKIQIMSLQNKLIKCNDYLTKRYKKIFNPLIKWMMTQQQDKTVSEINNYLYDTYEIKNEENNLIDVYNYLYCKKILIKNFKSISLLDDSNEKYNEISFSYNIKDDCII